MESGLKKQNELVLPSNALVVPPRREAKDMIVSNNVRFFPTGLGIGALSGGGLVSLSLVLTHYLSNDVLMFNFSQIITPLLISGGVTLLGLGTVITDSIRKKRHHVSQKKLKATSAEQRKLVTNFLDSQGLTFYIPRGFGPYQGYEDFLNQVSRKDKVIDFLATTNGFPIPESYSLVLKSAEQNLYVLNKVGGCPIRGRKLKELTSRIWDTNPEFEESVNYIFTLINQSELLSDLSTEQKFITNRVKYNLTQLMSLISELNVVWDGKIPSNQSKEIHEVLDSMCKEMTTVIGNSKEKLTRLLSIHKLYAEQISNFPVLAQDRLQLKK